MYPSHSKTSFYLTMCGTNERSSLDINECTTGAFSCTRQDQCVNTIGAHQCCPTGFYNKNTSQLFNRALYNDSCFGMLFAPLPPHGSSFHVVVKTGSPLFLSSRRFPPNIRILLVASHPADGLSPSTYLLTLSIFTPLLTIPFLRYQ